MFWSDSIHLTHSKYFIHGPFNHKTHDDIIQPKRNVALTRLELLLSSVTTYLNSQQIFPEKEKEIISQAPLILLYAITLIILISMISMISFILKFQFILQLNR